MEENKEEIKTTLSKNKNGYGYKYTDIAEIHRYLEENNSRYYQYIERIDNDDYVMTVKIINGEEQKPLRGCRVVQATLQGIKNPAQEQGSALTYARRYSLLMAFGLATEDDDAQSLNQKKEKQETEITTKEQAEEYKLSFGKYAGKNLKEIIEKDKSYANWLYKNEKTEEKIKKCLELLSKKPANEKQEEVYSSEDMLGDYYDNVFIAGDR